MWRAQRIAQASARALQTKTSVPSCAKRTGSSCLLMEKRVVLFSNGRRRRTVPLLESQIISSFSTRTKEYESSDGDEITHDTPWRVIRHKMTRVSQDREEAEDIRELFFTLRAISTAVPRKLVSAGATAGSDARVAALAPSWRDSAAFENYRDGSFHHWKSNSSMEIAEQEEEEDEDWEADLKGAIMSNHQSLRQRTAGGVFSNITREEDTSSLDGLDENPLEKASDSTRLSSSGPFISDEEYDAVSLVRAIENELSTAIRDRRVDEAIGLFEKATVEHGVDLSPDVVQDLFRLLSYHRPFHCYQMLQYILENTDTNIFTSNETDGLEPGNSGASSQQIGELYRSVCYSMRLLDPVHSRHGDIRSLIGSVISDLKQLDENVERMCLPVLVTSLVEQRSASVGRWASHYYYRMAAQNYELHPDYFVHLLSCSKYNRQNDLPYHDILRQVVQAGKRPFPHIVMNALENMFPYSEDVEATYIAVQSVMDLQRQSIQREVEQQERKRQDELKLAQEQDPEKIQSLKRKISRYREENSYIIDLATLESIFAASARTACVELNLLLWDCLEVMGHQATESMYESTIVCFAQNDSLWENAFIVLKDMEDSGFVPSRALVKGFGTALRNNFRRLDLANELLQSYLTGHSDAITFSPTAMNVLMSAFAERGNVDRTLSLLDEFHKSDKRPNVDSFAFALESIGKATARMVKNEKLRMSAEKRSHVIESYLSMTDRVLTQMENESIEPSNHVIRNYVEFLCLADQVDTATGVVKDLLERQIEREPRNETIVENKTILRVAVANAECGNFGLSRRLAASTSEHLPFMDSKIDKIEERLLQNRGQSYDDNGREFQPSQSTDSPGDDDTKI